MKTSPSLEHGGDLDGGDSSLELQGMLHAMLHRVWVIVLGAVLLGSLAAWYVRKLPDQWESRSTLQIEAAATQPVGKEDRPETTDLHDPMVMETVVQNFHNHGLLEAVSKQLNLAENPAFLRRNTGMPAPQGEIDGRLNAGLFVTPRAKTLLADVTYRHPDASVARQVASSLVEQFVAQNTEQQLRQAEVQNTLLAQKAAQLRDKMKRSEEAVQAYKNKVESVSMDTGRNLVEAKLQNLNNSLSEARNERLKVESDLHLLQSVTNRTTERLLGIASVAADPEVVAAQARVKTLEDEIRAMEDRYRAKHPRMIEAHNRLDQAKAGVDSAVKAAPDRLSARFDGAAASEQTIEKAAAAQEKELLRLDEKATPYRALQQELEADRALYDGVTKKLKESSLVMDIKPVNFRIVEPATAAYPIKSYRVLLLISGVLAGALLGAALLAVIYFLDSSIKTVDDAERILGLPVLSAVPLLSKVKSPAELLSLLSRPDSPVAESYRSLRTALSLLGPVASRKVFMFTSAVPGEGKTLTTANTAVAFAQQGLKTVVLEADLRKPMLARLFFDPAEKKTGISEFLVGESPVPHATEIPNLFVLPAGGMAPNPAELLAGPRFAELVEQLKGQFDRVVIDTAPVNVVSDTLSILATAQTIVLVVRHGLTSRKAVRRALELLRRAHAKADGVVLNMMPQWSGIGHHYYYSANSKYGGEGTYGTNYPGRAPALVQEPAAP